MLPISKRYATGVNTKRSAPPGYFAVRYWIGSGSGCEKTSLPSRSEEDAETAAAEMRSMGFSAQATLVH